MTLVPLQTTAAQNNTIRINPHHVVCLEELGDNQTALHLAGGQRFTIDSTPAHVAQSLALVD